MKKIERQSRIRCTVGAVENNEEEENNDDENDAFNAFVEVFDKVPTEGKQRVGRDFEFLFNIISIKVNTSDFVIKIIPIHYRRKRERSSKAVDVKGYGSNFIWSTKTGKAKQSMVSLEISRRNWGRLKLCPIKKQPVINDLLKSSMFCNF